MPDEFLAPGIGIAAVMAHAGIVVDHRAVEVPQEQVCCDGIGQRRSVIALVFVIPVAHGVVIGISKGDPINALVHLHVLVGIGADRGQIVFHCQIYVGGADALVRLGGKPAHNLVLPFSGQSAAAAEFGKAEGIGSVAERLDFPVQPLLGGFTQGVIVVAHPEVDLVDDLKQIDLKLHGREQRPVHHDVQLSLVRAADRDVIPDWVPQAQELHVVVLDKADRAQIVQLLLPEAQGAQMIDLGADLLYHFFGEHDVLVAALKEVLAAQVRVLVEDHLVHVEFVKVRIQKG